MSQTAFQTRQETSSLPLAGGILQRKCDCGQHTIGGSACDACSRKQPMIQRHAEAVLTVRGPEVPAIVHETLRSPGQPLDGGTNSFMGARFGHDFSHVRVHTDARAAESARAVNALAYTVGSNVVFAAGQYPTETRAGRELLAHELAHVVQQDQGRTSSSGLSTCADLHIGAADDLLEREADAAAASVLDGESVTAGSRPTMQLLQRVPDERGRGHGTLSYREATELATCMRIMGQANAAYCQQQALGLNPQPAPTQSPSPSSFSGRVVTPRGANPASCMTPLCSQIRSRPVPASDAQVRLRVNEWLDGALACVRSGASASGASHYPEIQANNENELRQGVNTTIQDYNAMTPGERAGRRREFRDWLTDDCRRSQREMEIEFHYNVVFENPPGSPPWGYAGAEWDDVEAALEALPAEAAWMNPRLLRFRRTACHPQDVDASGQCTGRGAGPARSFVGGMTDAATGEIQIFNPGLGRQPFGRSQQLQLPATFQTLRHEVGHVVVDQVPANKRREFFDRVLGWRQYLLTLLRAPVTQPLAREEQTRLCVELAMWNRAGDCDNARLTTFLNHFQNPGDRRVVDAWDQRTYIQLDGLRLLSILTAQLPQGDEFSYALMGEDEYLAELFALAISRPEMLQASLTAVQIAWLKENVFHTPPDMNSLANNLALNEPQRTEFLVRGRLLFTWEQLEALFNSLLVRGRYGRAGAEVA